MAGPACPRVVGRRACLQAAVTAAALAGAGAGPAAAAARAVPSVPAKYTPPAPASRRVEGVDAGGVKESSMAELEGKDYGKSRMRAADFTLTESGLQFKDLKEGAGPSPAAGQTAVVDWDGYTIGYYGRPFEARNKPKGSSFEGADKDFFRFTIGSGQVIPGFEEAVLGMRPGGIRRIIVPVEIGYPRNSYKEVGPKPSTFAGKRALSFVLENQGLVDKTLLFDIELIKIQKAAG